MLAAFSVAPSGGDDASGNGSVHDAVAAALQVVRASGLPNETSSMFTTVEGEWDEVFGVIKAATEAVAAFGPRVSLVVKADIRPGFTGEITGKVERVEQALARNPELLLVLSGRDEATDSELVLRVAQLVTRIQNSTSSIALRHLLTHDDEAYASRLLATFHSLVEQDGSSALPIRMPDE